MALESEDRDELIKSIRLLASDDDSECLAAVRAIKGILQAASLSFDDVAEIAKHIDIVSVTEVEVIEACSKLLNCDLSAREREFIEVMKGRFELKPDFELTEEQTDWLSSLYRRHVQNNKPASGFDFDE